jgi:eukaryotic-like serine/threonine-protein kinase
MTNPFGPNPFEGNPFGAGPPGPPFAPPPAPPVPPRGANVLATLSVVFAFVFAPAGALLGHLGLNQIRRTGERGRDRALVGLTLSYVFIAAAVVALVVGVTQLDTRPARVAAPTTTTTTPTTTTTTTTPPPPPTVAPADVDGLLPSLEDVESITGDSAMKPGRAIHQPAADPARGTIDRPDCWPVMEAGAPEGYDLPAITGFAEKDFIDNHDVHHQWVSAQSVAAFHDPTAAQAQLTKLLANLRQCGGSTMHATWPNGKTYPVVMRPPVDAGNGITTMDAAPQMPTHISCVQGVAAKANVVIQAGNCTTDSTDRSQQAAVAATNLILGRIPG